MLKYLSFFILLFLSISTYLSAFDYYWIGEAPDNNWNTENNWSTNPNTTIIKGFPDDNNDSASINRPGDIIITTDTTIGNLRIDSANATVTLGANLIISDEGSHTGWLEIGGSSDSTGTLAVNGNTIEVDGNIYINSGGTLDASINNSVIYIKGDWSNKGTFHSGSDVENTVYFNSGSIQILDAGGLDDDDKDFYNLVVSNGTILNLQDKSNCEIDNSLIIKENSSLNMNNQNIDFGESIVNKYLTIEEGSLWYAGDNSRLQFEGPSIIADFNPAPLKLQNLGNIVFSYNNITLSSPIQVKNVTITNTGCLVSTGFDIYIKGNWDNNGIYFPSNNTIHFNGGGDQTIDAGGINNDKKLSNIEVNNSTILHIVNTDCEIDGTLKIIGNSTIDNSNNRNIQLGGDLTIWKNCKWIPDASSSITFKDNLSLSDNNDPPNDLGNIIIGLDNNVTEVTQKTHIQVDNITINRNSIFNSDGYNLYVSGDWTNNNDNGRNYIQSKNTVYFNGSETTINSTQVFYNMFIIGNVSIDNVDNLIYVINLFKLTAGNFNANTNNIKVKDFEQTGGNFNLGSGKIILSQDFNHAGGKFNPGSGEIEFIGNATSTIYGDTSFYIFRCETASKCIYFGAGTMTTIVDGGSFIVEAPTNNTIFLNTSDDEGNLPLRLGEWLNGDQWGIDININADRTIKNVDVKMSYAKNPILIDYENVKVTSCYNWIYTTPVFTSKTIDILSNGKIDIEVQTKLPLNDDFTQLKASVEGYIVDGFETGTPYDEYFIIKLNEKMIKSGPRILDTDKTPTWRILSNTSLKARDLNNILVSTLKDVTPSDGAPPIIGYTMAVADKNEVFIHFSEPVKTIENTEEIAINSNHFRCSAGPISNIRRVTTFNTIGTKEAVLILNGALTIADIITPATISIRQDFLDFAENPNIMPAIANFRNHRITDIGLGLKGNGIIEPIWAKNQNHHVSKSEGIGIIRDFEKGSDTWLEDQDIILQAFLSEYFDTDSDTSLFYDINISPSCVNNSLWLPYYNESAYFSGLVPSPNSAAREVHDIKTCKHLRNYLIDSEDSEIKDNVKIEFIFKIPTQESEILYCANVLNPDSENWYRTVRPWSFNIHDIIHQRKNISILNNVINPIKREITNLHYKIEKDGFVNIFVFDLKGDIVDILYKGRKKQGNYSISWNGRNRGDRIVARGIYFVKIVAPFVEEIRKVLVVK